MNYNYVKYGSLGNAADKSDGLAVLGYFFEVSVRYSTTYTTILMYQRFPDCLVQQYIHSTDMQITSSLCTGGQIFAIKRFINLYTVDIVSRRDFISIEFSVKSEI